MSEEIKYIFQLGELFERVQMEKVFADSKTFVDSFPKKSLAFIQKQYVAEKNKAGFDLKNFVYTYFEEPPSFHTGFVTQKNTSLSKHVSNLWNILTRHTDETGNSLIPLPRPYVVPGGRFREMFYWDSYFTMLGLKIDGRDDLIKDMIENFAHLIEKFGYIPNGNRTYFLGRSQPPFLALMLELTEDENFCKQHLNALKKEYAFWMKGEKQLSADCISIHRVARLDDGSILNRYWDENNTPRPEAFKKDMDWAKETDDKKKFFRHERAACESGWDFSSRWLGDGNNIATMRTADLIPIDLNCLLYNLEKMIAELSGKTGDRNNSSFFENAATKRKAAIQKYCWNDQKKCYFDFDFINHRQTEELTIAIAAPLFTNVCTQSQSDHIAQILEEKFLKDGGFLTTLKVTGQQWDAPNGWAPLEWIAIQGLMNYGHEKLAKKAAGRWCKSNEKIFEQTGKMMEKYNVELSEGKAEAGTYPTQDGFGWTNGVYLACQKLLNKQIEQ